MGLPTAQAKTFDVILTGKVMPDRPRISRHQGTSKRRALRRERERQTKKCFSSDDWEKVQLTDFAFRKLESVSPRNYKLELQGVWKQQTSNTTDNSVTK
ncbi:hypothetical protein Naga_100125g13 [Nannochloropsis gaditana]|uniref:Uncharacterized protein n=1 Tax=Nannochloropsis gaditana TaxID=72520 RepID=W7TKP1_9STRA|nr:hypothetical protein Naga_100125g13 [Nannochloropsis gaditana]